MKKMFLITFLLLLSNLYAIEIGKFICPVPIQYQDKITSNQGLRDAISAEEAGGLATSGLWHNGIDYAVPVKTPVFAAKDGIVETVYPSLYNGPKWKGDRVYGGLIIVKHNDGTITLYAHLSMTLVTEGTEVFQGQQIGLSGGERGKRGSGVSTGPHLHFAIYLNASEYF